MVERKAYQPGTFCWVDLGTTDVTGAKVFYSELMNWNPVDEVMGTDGIYTLLKIQGKDMGGMYQLWKEQLDMGISPHWLPYVAVDHVDEMVDRAENLGGRAVMEPMDCMNMGRSAMIQDPTGAMFAMWQSKNPMGTEIHRDVGSMIWCELMTKDIEMAKPFYTQLFGWKTEMQHMRNMPYMVCHAGHEQAGGMMQIPKEWGDMPSHWMVYFGVSHCDQSLNRAMMLGGQMMIPPQDIPNMGRFATLCDPQGAVFSILQMTMPK